MSGIRVTYSGLISLVTGLASVFTSTIFTLITTRSLLPQEFGTWTLIYDLIVYMFLMEPVISYWVTREIARGIESGRTAVVSSGILSIGGMLGYFVLTYFVANQVHVDQNVLIFAVMLIPLIFLNRTLTGINLGWKPHVVSYSTISFGIAQIPLALFFLFFLHMGLPGLIVTNSLAYLVSNIILVAYAKEKIRIQIKKEFFVKWLRLSWIPLYPSIGSLVFWLDIVIFSIFTGSVVGLAYWSAVLSIVSIIASAGLISRAVYPKLLEGGNTDYLKENLIQLFYFAIPLTALIITFARPALFALNPLYEIAFMVLVLMSFKAFFNTLATVFQSFLMGAEKVDLDENSTFVAYVKSKLFFIPTLTLIQNVIYVSLLVGGLLILLHKTNSQLDLVIYWAIVALATQVPFTIYLYIITKRKFKLTLDFNSIFKYLLVSIGVFSMIYLLTEKFLIYNKNIFEFLPTLLLFVIAAIFLYVVVTYLVDLRTRKLFKNILIEIKRKIS